MENMGMLQEIELMKRRWIVYTGSKDKNGNPLLTFQLQTSTGRQSTKLWTSDDLLRIIYHMIDMVELMTSHPSAAFVIDFRGGCSDQKMTLILQTLMSAELDRKGAIAMVYIVIPTTSAKRRIMKRVLGIKRVRNYPAITHFKTVLLSNIVELYRHVEVSQLTSDLGGTMTYDNDEWIRFHKCVLPCLAIGEDILERTTDLQDKVLLLREYDFYNKSVHQLMQLRDELQDNYIALIRDSELSNGIDKCKQTLHQMEQLADNQSFNTLNPDLITNIKQRVRTLYSKLTQCHKELNCIWAEVEKDITHEIDMKNTSEEAEKICDEFAGHFWPEMCRHPRIADSLEQATRYRNDFNFTIHEPAKGLIENATRILQRLYEWQCQRLAPPNHVTSIVSKLSRVIHPFTTRLDDIIKTYARLHAYFHLYNNAAIWYNKAVSFIPQSLCQQARHLMNIASFVQSPDNWRQTTRQFLKDNPPPREDHLHTIDSCREINPVVSRKATILANRIRMLVTLLYEVYLDQNILRNVQIWKDEPLFVVTELQYDDPFESKISGYSPAPTPYPGETTRLRRRISRTKSMKPKPFQYSHGSSTNLRRVSSVIGTREYLADTQHFNRERFVSLSQEDLLAEQLFVNISNPDLHLDEEVFEYQSFKNTITTDCDRVVDFITNITTNNALSSETKIQYISNALSTLELHTHSSDASFRTYGQGKDPILRTKSYNDNEQSRDAAAQTILEITSRLSRSLNDVNFDESLRDAEKPVDGGTPQAVSLTNIATPDRERYLWEEVEKALSIEVSTKCESKASLGTCDGDVSSRSNDDTDDVDDSGPMLRRDRPMRQNIRRKRRSATELMEVNIDEALSQHRLGRRHSAYIPASKKLGGVAYASMRNIGHTSSANHLDSSESIPGTSVLGHRLVSRDVQVQSLESIPDAPEQRGDQTKCTDNSSSDNADRQQKDLYSSADMGYHSSPNDTARSGRNQLCDEV